MSVDTITKLCWAGVVLSALCWLAFQWRIGERLHAQLRETSRFPLFAARDRLVALVAEGRVREDDEGWRALYCSVNSFLGMHQKLHAFDIAVNYLRFMLAIARDPELEKTYERERRTEDDLVAKVPAFAEARDAVNEAMVHLVARRTTRLHEALLLGFVLMIRVATIALRFGLRPAAFVGRAMIHPSADTLRNWQSAQRARA